MKEAVLYTKNSDRSVACALCAHRCAIAPGASGLCRVRRNDNGVLRAGSYGEVIAAHLDPIEKKPLYHFLPGTLSFSIAAAGCNFRCSFCQNWEISQVQEPSYQSGRARHVRSEDIVTHAVTVGARSISYTYTEPTVCLEYARETALLARAAGLANVFVTNGYMTEEALALAAPWLDAANVDLKFPDDAGYAAFCGARHGPVLETIRRMRDAGIWVEVTTLVIPGANDADAALVAIARQIAAVSRDIPWHVSAFHPDYRMLDTAPTDAGALERAVAAGKEAGLRFLYPGNLALPADTVCPSCGAALITREGFSVRENVLDHDRCPECAGRIPGVFRDKKEAR